MRTHEHALLSVAYVGGIVLLADKGLADPWLYISAIIGGEIIDFIDHPLYHLLYQRKDGVVKEGRKILSEKGLKAYIQYLNKEEDKRTFNKLLLHNVYSLTIVAVLGLILSLFLPGEMYIFIFLGSFILHMLVDIFGDFWILGHSDNWTWVISDKILNRIGKLGSRLTYFIMLWLFIIIGCFFIVTFRWTWQINYSSTYNGLLKEFNNSANIWLAYTPLILLTSYLIIMLILCITLVRKYSLEFSTSLIQKRVFFSTLSIKKLPSVIFKRSDFNKIFLEVQSDIVSWIILATTVITISLLTLHWFKLDSEVLIFVVPASIALLFGTFIHSTAGEFGGAFGVLVSWILNALLSRLGLTNPWDVSTAYILFFSAITAWILGLIGAIFVKGRIITSVSVFYVQICSKNPGQIDTSWLKSALDIVSSSLEEGYHKANQELFGQPKPKKFSHVIPNTLILTPYNRTPIIGDDYFQFCASDSYNPIIREVSYLLCHNRLTSMSNCIGKYGLLPIFPRQRFAIDTITFSNSQFEMSFSENHYNWNSSTRPFQLPIHSQLDNSDEITLHPTHLTKTWSEFIDHLVTRSSNISTNIVVFPSTDQLDNITICGVTQERTSTKDYATVESEYYNSEVIRIINSKCEEDSNINISKLSSARLFYPKTSFYDYSMSNEIQKQSILPSKTGSFTPDEVDIINKTINIFKPKNAASSTTNDFSKKTGIWIIEVLATTLIGIYTPVMFNIILQKLVP